MPRKHTILECPDCSSHRAAVLATKPPRARCVDCDKVYPIHTESPADTADSADPDNLPLSQKLQNARKGSRDRSEVQPIADPPQHYLDIVREHGPKGLIATTKRALAAGARYGEDLEEQFQLVTPYLKHLLLDPRTRARHGYALKWRPRFLAVLALSNSTLLACRSAGIVENTWRHHCKADPEFAQQVQQAKDHATQLIYDTSFRSVVEGDLEPVYWQGVKVGHVRKFDSRLRVEFLRAHLPNQFKTPGNQPININQTQQILVLDPASRHLVQQAREAALRRMAGERDAAQLGGAGEAVGLGQ